MLSSVLKSSAWAVLLGTITAAGAQSQQPSETPNLPGVGAQMSPEAQQRARQAAEQAFQRSQEALQSEFARKLAPQFENTRRRVDDMADKEMASERDAALRFLGIPPEADHALYFFVSWSMPRQMLQAYALEAMWSGGTLVFRGVPPGKKLDEFLIKDIRSLVSDKGASANVSIDPRLYDAYEIKHVPTIVLTTERSYLECTQFATRTFSYKKQSLSYEACAPMDPAKYWKISGTVTTGYALREFIASGGSKAQLHLDALAKGPRQQGRDMKPFSGKWDAVPVPQP